MAGDRTAAPGVPPERDGEVDRFFVMPRGGAIEPPEGEGNGGA